MSKEKMLLEVHSFCRGEYMLGKGCKDCPINHLRVCDEGKGGKRMDEIKLAEAVRIIGEVINNGG